MRLTLAGKLGEYQNANNIRHITEIEENQLLSQAANRFFTLHKSKSKPITCV
jgi:hypothetical protein